MDPAISAAIVAGLFLLAHEAYKHHNKRLEEVSKKLSEVQEEVRDKEDALKLYMSADNWDPIYDQMSKLCETTEVDRILALRCWNGEKTPTHTKSLFQHREGEQERVEYWEKLDPDYVMRVSDMLTNNIHVINTSEIPNSLIKRIYTKEGVQHSVWFPVFQLKLGTGTVVYTYMSFATHDSDAISEETIELCRGLVWAIGAKLEESPI